MDGESQLIVAAGLSNCASDSAQLVPVVKAAEHNVGVKPRKSDGYCAITLSLRT